MKKVLIILSVLFIAGISCIMILGSMFMGSIAKEAINTLGPKLTQTELSVESVGLNPLLGSGSIKGFLLGNPDGFNGEKAISLDNIKLDVDMGSLLSGDVIIIEKLHVLGPSVAYERTFRSSNVADILKNVQSFSESVTSSADSTSEPEASPVRVIIKDLVIDGGKVGLTLGGQTVSLPMPRVEQRDIGAEQGGIAADEALGAVFNLMLQSIGSATADASKKIANQGTDTVKRLSEGVGSIFGGDK